MSRPDDYSVRRYLAARRTVDDRAVHRPTVERLAAALSDRAARRDGPVRVLEVGSGAGSALRRLVAWDVLPYRVTYTGIDLRESVVADARQTLPTWGRDRGYEVVFERPIHLAGDDRTITAEFGVVDAFSFAAREADEREWDLLVGASFLDQVELREALDALFPLLAPGGLWWFPLTFDGTTTFATTHGEDGSDAAADDAFERRVVDAYHAAMDDPGRPGGSRAGRELLSAAGPGDVLATGAGDRIISPTGGAYDPAGRGEATAEDDADATEGPTDVNATSEANGEGESSAAGSGGAYPGDEAYALHHTLRDVERVVADSDADVDRDRLADWFDARHRAVDRGALTYVSHRLDVLGTTE